MARKRKYTRKKSRSAGTRRADVNKRRKGFLAVMLPWMRRFGIALAVVVIVIWLSSWLYLSGSMARGGEWARDRFVEMSADLGFRVKDILVEGRENASAEIILAIINMQEDDPLLAFNPQEVRAQLEKISWVEKAYVQRRWPDTLYIRLEERQPTALYKSEAGIKLLDEKGENIATDQIEPFKHLLRLSGEGAAQNLSTLLKDLETQPEIKARVSGAQRIGNRRWDLLLKDGKEIKLPEHGVLEGLQRLVKAHNDSAILDKDIIAIDLREDDRIAVRTRPGAVQDYRTMQRAGDNI